MERKTTRSRTTLKGFAKLKIPGFLRFVKLLKIYSRRVTLFFLIVALLLFLRLWNNYGQGSDSASDGLVTMVLESDEVYNTLLEQLNQHCKFPPIHPSMSLSADEIRGMENPDLLDYIRMNVLIQLGSQKDAKEAWDGNVSQIDPSSGRGFTSKFLVPYFFSAQPSTPGLFFEAGALDGVFHSTTFYLEKSLGWRGMLGEANPSKIPEIIDKSNRTSVLAPVCLSPEPKPCLGTYAVYHPAAQPEKIPNWFSWYGGLHVDKTKMKRMGKGWRMTRTPVHCFPLYSILKAGNLSTLDFLSLDLEGTELWVLATLPWGTVEAEVIRLDLHDDDRRIPTIRFLRSRGYTFHRDLLKNSYANERDSHIFSKA